MSYTNLKLFALSSNQELAAKVADKMGIELGKSSVREFSDGEIQVNIEESIRGHHVFILQSTSSPVNDNLMEILIMVDALKRASAETISVVMVMHVKTVRHVHVNQSHLSWLLICLRLQVLIDF